MSVRDKQMDGIKFVLILLVVFGHMTHPEYNLDVYKYIYAFHMPTFVFLSGFFSSRTVNVDKMLEWTKKMLLIYVLSQSVLNVISYLCGENISMSRWVCITPKFTLWYLISLVIWRLFFRFVFNKINLIFLLVLSIVFASIAGFIPIGQPLSFQRTLVFFPLFILGYIFKEYKLVDLLDKLRLLLCVVTFILCLCISYYFPIFIPEQPYANFSEIVVRFSQLVIGAIMALAIIRLLRIPVIEKFSSFGQYTLWVFLGHSFIIVMQNKLLKMMDVKMNEILAVCLACFYVGLITSIAILWERHLIKSNKS